MWPLRHEATALCKADICDATSELLVTVESSGMSPAKHRVKVDAIRRGLLERKGKYLYLAEGAAEL